MKPTYVLEGAFDVLLHGRPHFISTEAAVSMARAWSRRLPRRYDLIVGIPRGGLFFASMMAQNLAIPLSTPDMLPKMWDCPRIPPPDRIKAILIVEDATRNGTDLLPAKQKAQTLFPDAVVHSGALYAYESAIIPLNTFAALIKDKEFLLFEWELMYLQSKFLATDLDGVLCEDWPNDKRDYLEWMQNVKPLMVPVYGVSAIITSRREEYRQVTVDWLRKQGIRFTRLLMDPTRDGKQNFIAFKIWAVNRVKPKLFLESSDEVARKVHWATGAPVLCTENMRLYNE